MGEIYSFFRAYKGEEECPKEFKGTNRNLIWLYENRFSEMEDTEEGHEIIMTYLKEYNSVGLIDFESNDGVYTNLKALLFNRYAKGEWSLMDAVEGFKKWYTGTYQKI